MSISTDAKKIDELLFRGVEEVIHEKNLREKLESGKQLRVKLGIDPTSPDLHLGRAIPILKLRDFQELGHTIVLIVGDFTGVIGDTSDKESERPMLTKETIEENQKTYRDQIAHLLDINTVEFRYNSEWLEPLTYREIGEHADQFSVAEFVARDNIKRRLDTGKRVSLREVLYPLLQGYDSVAVAADVELGGTDQRFNLLAGRVLQEHFKMSPQDIVMNPLINGLDGRKMSSSWGNTIPLTAEPADMFGKVMSMQDAEIATYMHICTRMPLEDVTMYEQALEAGENPRDVKMKLAHEIVTLLHSHEAAEIAQATFIETFQKRVVPEGVLEVVVPYIEKLIEANIVESKSALRRLLDAGGVRDAQSGEKLTEIPESLSEPMTLKIGKRRFVRLLP